MSTVKDLEDEIVSRRSGAVLCERTLGAIKREIQRYQTISTNEAREAEAELAAARAAAGSGGGGGGGRGEDPDGFVVRHPTSPHHKFLVPASAFKGLQDDDDVPAMVPLRRATTGGTPRADIEGGGRRRRTRRRRVRRGGFPPKLTDAESAKRRRQARGNIPPGGDAAAVQRMRVHLASLEERRSAIPKNPRDYEVWRQQQRRQAAAATRRRRAEKEGVRAIPMPPFWPPPSTKPRGKLLSYLKKYAATGKPLSSRRGRAFKSLFTRRKGKRKSKGGRRRRRTRRRRTKRRRRRKKKHRRRRQTKRHR